MQQRHMGLRVAAAIRYKAVYTMNGIQRNTRSCDHLPAGGDAGDRRDVKGWPG